MPKRHIYHHSIEGSTHTMNSEIVVQEVDNSWAAFADEQQSEVYMDSVNGTLNESYITATGDSSQYFSVLDTSTDTVQLDTSHLNASQLDTTLAESEHPVVENNDQIVENIDQQQVVLFKMDGTDDLYAIQVAEDEHGNLQKYQFKVQQTSDGQFEAVPDTITMVPLDHDEMISDNVQQQQPQPHIVQRMQEPPPLVKIETRKPVEIKKEYSSILESRLMERQERAAERTDVRNFNTEEFPQFQFNEHEEVSEIDTKAGILASNNQLNMSLVPEETTNCEIDQPDMVYYDTAENEQPDITVESEERSETPEETVPMEEAAAVAEENEEYGMTNEKDYDDEIIEYVSVEQDVLEEDVVHEEADGEGDSQGYTIESNVIEDPDYENEEEPEEVFSDAVDPTEDDTPFEPVFVPAEKRTTTEIQQFIQNANLHEDDEEPEPQAAAAATLSVVSQKPLHDGLYMTQIITTKPELVIPHKYLKDLKLKKIVTTSGGGGGGGGGGGVEKENLVESNTTAKSKPNPRSILKSSHTVLHKKPDPVPPIDRRFAKSKEIAQRLMFHNFIAQTTIVQAPIRQERLPRKQTIKPLKRTDEEIIVQEMVVSSNGFMATTENGVLRENGTHSTSLITDSDSDYKVNSSNSRNGAKRKRKYRKRKANVEIHIADSGDSADEVSFQQAIEMSEDTDGEAVETIIINSPGKRRGRPPKPKLGQSPPGNNSGSGKRRGRPPKNKTPPEESIELCSTENKCSKCPKVFPSLGSLRSHMNYHNFEESKDDEVVTAVAVEGGGDAGDELSTLVVESVEDCVVVSETQEEVKAMEKVEKYKCGLCESSFKNNFLLTKHQALHTVKNAHECKVCKRIFSDAVQLNTHRRSHVKQTMFNETTTTQLSPKMKRPYSIVSTRKSMIPSSAARKSVAAPKHTCTVCAKGFSTQILHDAHVKVHRQHKCSTCATLFASKLLLDNHVRVECVKSKSPAAAAAANSRGTRISFLVRKPTSASPNRTFARPSKPSLHSKQLGSPTSRLRKLQLTRTRSESTVTSSQESIASSKSIKSHSLQLKIKCDSCELVFNSHTLLFHHKVVVHGMSTPDKKNVAKDAARVVHEKKALYKPVGEHSGVPAKRNVVLAFAQLKEKLDKL